MFQNQIKVRFMVLLACWLFAIWPDAMAQSKAKKPSAPSDPPKCDCQHIPALKRDIDDSKWLAQAHADKAAKLEAKEIPLYRRLAGLADASDEMTALWDDYNTWEGKTVKEEFKKARGYEDTTSVAFDEKTNKPDPKQLEAARKQAPCLRIAEAISGHEQAHADLRTPGSGLHERPSQLALEEKAHYEYQVAFVQEEVNSLEKICWRGTVTYSRTTMDNSEEVGPTDNWILKNTRRHESSSSYQVEITIAGGSGGTRLQSTAIISTAAEEGGFSDFIDAQPCGKTPARLEIISKDTNNYSGNATQELYGIFNMHEDGSYEVSFDEPRAIVEQGTHAFFHSATGYCIPEKNKPPTNGSEAIKNNRGIDRNPGITFSGRLDPLDPDNLHGTWTKKEPWPTPLPPGAYRGAETVITWKIQRPLPPGK